MAPNPTQLINSCVISSFFREAEEICDLLGSYAAYDINSGQPVGPILKGQESVRPSLWSSNSD
jgi:hypothetical protein